MTSAVESIKKALVILASRCDGANTEDGAGFNKLDSGFGKSLAGQVKAGVTLSEKQLLVALKMIRKYEKTQLNSSGVFLPTESAVKIELNSSALTPASVSRKIDLVGELVEVHFDYNPAILSDVKSIEPKGRFTSNARGKFWVFPASALEAIVNKLLPSGFILSETVLSHIQAEVEENRINTEASTDRVSWCMNYLNGLANTEWKFKPFKHQWEGVKFFLGQKNLRALIADDMGTGKTFTALMCAKALQAWYKHSEGVDTAIYITAPVSLKMNWFKEAAMVSLEVEVFSYAKLPTPLETKKYIVISDEIHYAQNIKSQRTQKWLTLVNNENCAGLIELTGTPLKNGRPSNLYPLLLGLQHPIAANRSQYEKRYCDAHATSFTRWDTSGASNLEELNKKISDQMIRRTKVECLDLPDKVFISIECESCTEIENEYDESLMILKQNYLARVDAGEVSENANALVFLGYFRRLASIFKSYHAINMVKELLEQRQSVVVFTDFVESAERIANHFNVTALTGSVPTEKTVDSVKVYPRQQLVDDFQSGKNKVFVGTIKAGGVGITLTRASYLIMVDRPFTPGDYNQATDRIHRIGQKNQCTIYDLYAKDIDFIMAALLNQKSDKIDKVLKKNKIDISKTSNLYETVLKTLMK